MSRRAGGRVRAARKAALALVKAECVARGCTCQPDYRHVHGADGVVEAQALHDHGCPALTGPGATTYLLSRETDGT